MFYVPAILYYVCKLFYDFRRWMHDPAILDYCFCLFALICFMIATYHAASFSFDHGGRRRLCFYSLCGMFFGATAMAGQDACRSFSSTAQARACAWPTPCRRSETANNLSFKVPCCSGRLVGADATFRPANYAAETRKSSANPLVPLGGQSRPPLRINCGSNNSQRVGVDAHIAPAVQAVFSEIFGEFAGSQWVDVGIDPYGHPGKFSKFAALPVFRRGCSFFLQ